MKPLFWVLVVCAIGWAFFMAATAPPAGQQLTPPTTMSGPDLTSGLTQSTNVLKEAGDRLANLSTNVLENIKGFEFEKYMEQDKLDEAGLALKSFSYSMTGFLSRISRDGWIISSIRARIVREFGPRMYQVDIDSKEGKVTLTGVVPDTGIRDRVVSVARGTHWVDDVDDRLVLAQGL